MYRVCVGYVSGMYRVCVGYVSEFSAKLRDFFHMQISDKKSHKKIATYLAVERVLRVLSAPAVLF